MLNRGNNAFSQRTTVVLVTNQFECERIINSGKNLSDTDGTDLLVLSVQSNEYPPNPEAMDYLFNVSSENGAMMNVTYSENVLKTLSEYIKSSNAVNIVSGMPSKSSSILHRLWNKFTNISFYTVDEKGTLQEVTSRKSYIN